MIGHFTTTVDRPNLRKQIRHVCRTDVLLTRFVCDYFPTVFGHFGEGMQPDHKITLLLSIEPLDQIAHALDRFANETPSRSDPVIPKPSGELPSIPRTNPPLSMRTIHWDYAVLDVFDWMDKHRQHPQEFLSLNLNDALTCPVPHKLILHFGDKFEVDAYPLPFNNRGVPQHIRILPDSLLSPFSFYYSAKTARARPWCLLEVAWKQTSRTHPVLWTVTLSETDQDNKNAVRFVCAHR